MNNDELLLDHLDGISYRKLVDRYEMNKDKLCKIVNEEIATFKKNIEITKHFFNQCAYSGNHIVDGKYIPVKEIKSTYIQGKIPRSRKRKKVKRGIVLIWGSDYDTHDIPNHTFGLSETTANYSKYFKILKGTGYEMKSCTIDDKDEIKSAILKWYPDCIIQQCFRHYLEKISRVFTIRRVRQKVKSYEKQLNNLFPDPEQDSIPITRTYALYRATQYINAILELEYQYELLLEFEDILTSILGADDYHVALKRIESLETHFLPRRLKMNYPKEQINLIKKSYKDFKEHQEYLLNHLKYPHLNIPSTTNLVEGYNSHLEMRLSSIKGFESKAHAMNYINVWILKKRFTPFSCCRKPFTHFNGKSPLQCAGVDVSKIDNWFKFCRKDR